MKEEEFETKSAFTHTVNPDLLPGLLAPETPYLTPQHGWAGTYTLYEPAWVPKNEF